MADGLGGILEGINCPFATSLSIPVSAAPVVRLKKTGEEFEIHASRAKGKTVETRPSGNPFYSLGGNDRSKQQLADRDAQLEEQNKRLKSLLDAMPRASFGHGQITKTDSSVRDALQLPADEFEVVVRFEEAHEGLQEKVTSKPTTLLASPGTTEQQVSLTEVLSKKQAEKPSILEQVQKSLEVEVPLNAELYALNVYQKNGHFKKHKDTPRGKDMVGTLVVSLPGAYYEGGAMEISAADRSVQVFSGAKKPSSGGSFSYLVNSSSPSDYHWSKADRDKQIHVAAFFSDIDHEIQTVSAGVRISVAFILRRADGLDGQEFLPKVLTDPSEKMLRLAQRFTQLARDPEFLPDGGYLAFPCFHLYTNSLVFPKKGDVASVALEPRQIANLKGKDAIIGKAVQHSKLNSHVGGGIDLFLQPYLTHEFSREYDNGDFVLEKFPAGKKVPRRMSDDDIERHFKATVDDDSSEHDIWVLSEEHCHKDECVGTTEWNAEGYFGNEASTIDFYVRTVLRLYFHDYEKRQFHLSVAEKKEEGEKNVAEGGQQKEAQDIVSDDKSDRDPEVVTEDGVSEISKIWLELVKTDPRPEEASSEDDMLFGLPKKKPMKAMKAEAIKRDFSGFEKKLCEKLAALYSDSLFLPDGGQLVFPCRSLFSSAGIHPKMGGDKEKIKANASDSATSSSSAAAAAAAAKAEKSYSTKTPLSVAQLKKLKDHENAIVTAAKKALPGDNTKFQLRIYVEDEKAADDGITIIGFHDKYPAKFPKRMHTRDLEFYLERWMAHDFDPSKPPKGHCWVGDFEMAAAELHQTETYDEFTKKTKRGRGGFGGGFGMCDFGDFDDIDDSCGDDDRLQTISVRSALHVLVPSYDVRKNVCPATSSTRASASNSSAVSAKSSSAAASSRAPAMKAAMKKPAATKRPSQKDVSPPAKVMKKK
eukprot:TRINITY_DN6006_c0_g5_i1.p1 TRINITY_DN6006_c0_g5~~TRINITY_DN6006_c0_g5_i1.p1  ORF type:complete len:967 (-),score=151.84 TRINITY_DN6006_c0_g5_i1:248-3034(-)